jgi:oxygen-independent coproporphyrinogen-3 oxidase
LSEKKSIYIHIPFCLKKCFYCDFYSVEDLTLQSNYTKALINEIKLRARSDSEPDPAKIDTIYFGGGTPSTLSLILVEQILSALYKNFTIEKNCEFTMEVNPGTIDQDYLAGLKAMGVNRLNIGVQSFQDDKLKFLGRIHSVKQAKQAIEYSRDAGFKNLGIDLIYGIPNQNEKNWIKDLTKALSYKLEHLSCYMLTFEKNTQLYSKLKQGLIKSVTKEELSSFFIKTSNLLTENNYIHYEISNFASSSKYLSTHNSNYWNQTPYLGFGASAHSFDNTSRFWNHSAIKKYITDLDRNTLPVAEREILTQEQKIIEMILLGLRTKKGVDLEKFGNRFNNILVILEKEKLGRSYHKEGKNNFSLTQKGMCYLDDIIQLFVDFI